MGGVNAWPGNRARVFRATGGNTNFYTAVDFAPRGSEQELDSACWATWAKIILMNLKEVGRISRLGCFSHDF